MKTIRFASEDQRQRQFAAALRKNVHDYFTHHSLDSKGNAAMYLKTAVLVFLYCTPFILILTVPMSVLPAAILMVIMGVGMAGVGMSVMHDAVHGAYSERKWINTVMGGSIYFIGSSVATWSIQHNYLHHRFTNITGYDEDIETKGFIRLSKNAPWRKYQRFQHIYAFMFYGFMTLAKLVGDFFQLFRYNRLGITQNRNEKPRREIVRMIITKSIYLAVVFGLPLWLTTFTWWQVLVGFFIMHMTGGMIMSLIFQMAHVVEGTEQPMPVNGTIPDEWTVHQLRTTSDFAPRNGVLGWYIGGLNFQVEHHLFPNICHIHYKSIAPIVQKTANEFGIPYHVHPTFGGALRSHFRMLRRLGKGSGLS